MLSVSATYDVGWFPGILSFPIEFSDQAIVFHNRNKTKNFELDYTRIDHVDLSYKFLGTLWCELWLKISPLEYLDKENSLDLRTWFPCASGHLYNFTYISFNTSYKYKEQIINLLKVYCVKLGNLPFSNHSIRRKT